MKGPDTRAAMTTLRFFKYHGLGNDFVLLDEALHGVQTYPDTIAQLARALCNRSTGIGADGLLVLCFEDGVPRMRITNADGSPAQMCGNGVRCIARHLLERHGASAGLLTIVTDRGPLAVEVHHDRGAFAAATVDMGPPIFEAQRVPVALPEGDRDPLAMEVPSEVARLCLRGVSRVMSVLSMGNPHAVIECDDPESISLGTLGPAMEHAAMFPEGVNAHFVHVVDSARVRMVTWERGAGATRACGTGACAVMVALASRGRIGRRATIRVPGGELLIAWRGSDDHLMMTGPAAFVFEGRTGPVVLEP
ncbi:MAG: diaminopimelate epimerase [Phycisphaerales bacterium]